jgi:Flp pilus assembly protein TadD
MPVTRGKIITVLTLAAVLGCGRELKYRQHLEAGLNDIKVERYRRAAHHFEKAVKNSPASSTAYCNLGIAYAGMQELDRAILALTMAADLESHDPRPMLLLSDVLREAGRWDDARDVLVKLQSGLPDDPVILTHLALLEYRVGEMDMAQSLLTQALAIDSKYAPALFNMAMLERDHEDEPLDALRYFSRYLTAVQDGAHADVEHVDKAETETQKLRLLLSNSRSPLLASVRPRNEPPQPESTAETQSETPESDSAATGQSQEGGNAQPAIEEPVSTFLISEPEASQAINRGDYEKALVRLTETVREEPRNASALWALAVTYDKGLGQSDKASSTYRLFAETFPADPRVDRARQLSQQSDPGGNQARDVAERAAFRKTLRDAVRHHQSGNIESAITLYERALAIDATNASVTYNVGMAYRSIDDLPSAQRAFEQALGLAPDMIKASYMLAVVQREQGYEEDAITTARRTITVDPENARAHFLLGILYHETNRNGLSRKHLEQTVALAPDSESAEKARTWLGRSQR